MNGDIVRLIFQSSSRGDGLENAAKDIQAVDKSLPGLRRGLVVVGSAFGSMGSQIANVANMLLAGGVWGAAMAAATFAVKGLIGWWDRLCMKNDEVTRKFREQQKALRSLEATTAAYQRRVQMWKDAKADADRAAADAQEAEKNAAETAKRQMEEAHQLALRYYDLQQKLADLETKRGELSDDEETRLRARIKLMLDAAKHDVSQKRLAMDHANRTGGGMDRELAGSELAIALKNQELVTAEARKMVKAYRDAKKLAEEKRAMEFQAALRADFMRAEAERKQREAQGMRDRLREKTSRQVQDVEKQIEAAKAEADALEENAARARGRSFQDWQRGERDRAREGRSDRTKRAMQANESELARLEEQARKSPRAMSQWARNRLARLREWKADQNPANNPALNAVNDLQAKRDKLLEDEVKTLQKIETLLQAATTL